MLLQLNHDLVAAVLKLSSYRCLERLAATCRQLTMRAREDTFWIIRLSDRWPEFFFTTDAIPSPRSLFARMLGAPFPTTQAGPVDPSSVRILLEITDGPNAGVLRLPYRLCGLEFRELAEFHTRSGLMAYGLPFPKKHNEWLMENEESLASRVSVALVTDEGRVLQGERLVTRSHKSCSSFRICPTKTEAREAARNAIQLERATWECWLSVDIMDGWFGDGGTHHRPLDGEIELGLLVHTMQVKYGPTEEPLEWQEDTFEDTFRRLDAELLGKLPWE